MRKIPAALLMAFAVAATIYLSGCSKVEAWLTGLTAKPTKMVIERRLKAEWESVAATEDLLDQGPDFTIFKPFDPGSGFKPGPGGSYQRTVSDLPPPFDKMGGKHIETVMPPPRAPSWDVGMFISSKAIQTATSRLQGFNATYLKDGILADSTITIEKVSVLPQVGALTATFAVSGASPKLGLTLGMEVSAIARFDGVEVAADGRTQFAKFRWAPLEVAPSADWGGLAISARGYAGALVAQVAELFANADYMVFREPLEGSFTIDPHMLDGMQLTIPTKPGEGTVTVKPSFGPFGLRQAVGMAMPVFLDSGIWLVGRASHQDLPKGKLAPEASDHELKAQIDSMRQKISKTAAAAAPVDVDFMLVLGSRVLLLIENSPLNRGSAD